MKRKQHHAFPRCPHLGPREAPGPLPHSPLCPFLAPAAKRKEEKPAQGVFPALTSPSSVPKVWPKQFICQHLNIITALTGALCAREWALHACKLEYIKLEFIESPPIRSKTSITFYNSLHSSNYIKIFICTLHDIYKRFIENI